MFFCFFKLFLGKAFSSCFSLMFSGLSAPRSSSPSLLFKLVISRLWRVPATLPYPDFIFTTRTLPANILKISGFRVVKTHAVFSPGLYQWCQTINSRGKELTKDYEIFHKVPPYIIQVYTSDKLTKMQSMNQHIFYLYLDRSRRGEKFSFSFLSFISSVRRVRSFSQHLMENVVG